MTQHTENSQMEHYLFVIDTNSYAGNFERDICAYMTGQIGECRVGEEEAEIARREIPKETTRLENLLIEVADEDGCLRPVGIFPNPRYGNDGRGNHAVLTDKNRGQFHFPAYLSVAIYFHEKPGSDLMDVLKERAAAFAKKKAIKIEGFRFLEQSTTYKEIEI